jgi:hypothetical protein
MAGTPYLSVTGITPTELSGEVFTDAKVTVALPNADKPLSATVAESSWKVALPRGTPQAGIRITAERAGKITTLSLPTAPLHSHALPAQPAAAPSATAPTR